MIAIRDPALHSALSNTSPAQIKLSPARNMTNFHIHKVLEQNSMLRLPWYWITLSSKMFFWRIEIDLNCMTVIWYQTWASGLCKQCAVFFNSYKELIHLYERVGYGLKTPHQSLCHRATRKTKTSRTIKTPAVQPRRAEGRCAIKSCIILTHLVQFGVTLGFLRQAISDLRLT